MLTITPQEYAAWRECNEPRRNFESAPASFLRHAGLLVANFLAKSTPLNENDQRQVIIDAVCTQAEYWHSLGITPFAEGLDAKGRLVASASLNGGSITYADNGPTKIAERAAAARTLCLESRLILQIAGATPCAPVVIG
ncbi:hypothetical protein [Schaalia sp. lx-100]|uniref:hypothetical protein n=1 Tax=Schaalia sp. lx-100 TaxID=2899081 RepID=UPI001E2DD343|nr:hypothetical protein [Schaalia sp. lx-100]MCD4558229.1 hypothetical protein [Schaalia sp. lx-100]